MVLVIIHVKSQGYLPVNHERYLPQCFTSHYTTRNHQSTLRLILSSVYQKVISWLATPDPDYKNLRHPPPNPPQLTHSNIRLIDHRFLIVQQGYKEGRCLGVLGAIVPFLSVVFDVLACLMLNVFWV